MNRLSTERRATILSMMVEGISLRAVSRLTGTGENTLARMLAEFGSVCGAYHNHAVRNFCRIHQTLRITPAMATGITDHGWSVEEVCRLAQRPVNHRREIERMMVAKGLGERTSLDNRHEA